MLMLDGKQPCWRVCARAQGFGDVQRSAVSEDGVGSAHRCPEKDQRGGEADRGAPGMQRDFLIKAGLSDPALAGSVVSIVEAQTGVEKR